MLLSLTLLLSHMNFDLKNITTNINSFYFFCGYYISIFETDYIDLIDSIVVFNLCVLFSKSKIKNKNQCSICMSARTAIGENTNEKKNSTKLQNDQIVQRRCKGWHGTRERYFNSK